MDDSRDADDNILAIAKTMATTEGQADNIRNGGSAAVGDGAGLSRSRDCSGREDASSDCGRPGSRPGSRLGSRGRGPSTALVEELWQRDKEKSNGASRS